jgi:DNA helicase HerA-like ATPase
MMVPDLTIGAANGRLVQQLGCMSNRHGLVAGATGTGKTVTLQVLAEGFSRMGVPVFAVDVKGDLSGLAAAGSPHPKIDERLAEIPLPEYRQQPCPAVFWDMDGKNGHPVRTTISEMGPLLLSNLLELNDTQTSVLYAAFLLWLLAELFEQLPECGDPPAPKLVLFFDEAHMLFDGAQKALLDKIEQVVRLYAPKG